MAALSEAEVIELLRREALTIAFDTNEIFRNDRDDPFIGLCDRINEINRLRRDGFALPPIKKVLPAPVYAEKLHDLRQLYGARYDHRKILGFLTSKRVDVVGFEGRHAEHVAEILGRLYPDDGAWQRFKREQCARCLGVSLLSEVSRKGKCSATIDWLIAGHADAEGLLLVTQDSREEFQGVRLKTTLDTLSKAAGEIYEELDKAADTVRRLRPGS